MAARKAAGRGAVGSGQQREGEAGERVDVPAFAVLIAEILALREANEGAQAAATPTVPKTAGTVDAASVKIGVGAQPAQPAQPAHPAQGAQGAVETVSAFVMQAAPAMGEPVVAPEQGPQAQAAPRVSTEQSGRDLLGGAEAKGGAAAATDQAAPAPQTVQPTAKVLATAGEPDAGLVQAAEPKPTAVPDAAPQTTRRADEAPAVKAQTATVTAPRVAGPKGNQPGDSSSASSENAERDSAAPTRTAAGPRASTGAANPFDSIIGSAQQAQHASAAEAPVEARPSQTTAQHADRPGLADQIAGPLSAQASRDGQQVVINLNPPELGRVRVTFRSEGQDLRCVMEVDNAQTLGQIQHERAGLIQRLADGGIQVRQLDVGPSESRSSSYSDAHTMLAGGNPGSQQQPSGGQQGAAGEQLQPARGSELGLQRTATGRDVAEEGIIGDGRLNVWI